MPNKSGFQVYCNADKIAGRFRRRAKSLKEVTQEVIKLDGQDLLAKARELSSLTDHSLKDLAKMGHPYRRGGGYRAAPHPAWLIHSQGGQFLRMWQLAVSRTQDGGTASVYNRSPYAWYLEAGTSKMIPRPILEHMFKATAVARKASYDLIRRAAIEVRGEVAGARLAAKRQLAQAARSPMSIISQSLRSGARALRMGAGI